MKRIPLYLFMFCIITTAVTAATAEYPIWGGTEQDFYPYGLSYWNAQNEDWTIADRLPFNEGSQYPLVTELDGDAGKEIVIFYDTKIAVIEAETGSEGLEMEYAAIFETNGTSGLYSNLITYDIDADGMDEIIIYDVDYEKMFILNYNGSHITNTGYAINIHTYTGGTQYNVLPTTIIGCGDPEWCVMVYAQFSYLGTMTTLSKASAIGFKDTTTTTPKTIYNEAGLNRPQVCLPAYRHLPYGNGRYYAVTATTYGHYLHGVAVNSSGHITDIDILNPNSPGSVLEVPGLSDTGCVNGTTQFTAPLVTEFDSSNTGEEVIYAYQISETQYRIGVYESDLSDEIVEYPLFQAAEGVIKSNPFTADAFAGNPDSKDKSSVCVLGYDSSEGVYGQIDLLCADKVSDEAGSTDNYEFRHELEETPGFNITKNQLYSPTVHSIESNQDARTEILTPYGVFKLPPTGGSECDDLNKVCTMEKIWDSPLTTEHVLIPIDFFDEGFQDIIALTKTNIYYFDDGFLNRNAYLADCSEIRPSPTTPWKLHVASGEITTIEPGYDENVATSFTYTTGKDEVGTYVLTQDLDGSAHTLKENGKDIQMTYTLTKTCEGAQENRIEIYGYWPTETPSDYLTVMLYNRTSSKWVNVTLFTYSATYKWVNETIGTDLDQYDGAGLGILIRFADQVTSDAADTIMTIDQLKLGCYGEEVTEYVVSNQTNKVEITAKVVDPDNLGDKVQARAVLYHGLDNAQDTGWSLEYASGTEIPLTDSINLYPNQTITGGILRIYYRDSTNYPSLETDYTDYVFSVVASGGAHYTESSFCAGLTPEEYNESITPPSEKTCDSDNDCQAGWFCSADGLCKDPTDRNDPTNSAQTAMKEFQSWTGLPAVVIFLFIMGALVYGIVTSGNTHPIVILGGSGLVVILGLVIGAKLGFIGAGTLLIILLATLVGGAFMLSRAFGGD